MYSLIKAVIACRYRRNVRSMHDLRPNDAQGQENVHTQNTYVCRQFTRLTKKNPQLLIKYPDRKCPLRL